jgi:hypothetical protein
MKEEGDENGEENIEMQHEIKKEFGTNFLISVMNARVYTKVSGLIR